MIWGRIIKIEDNFYNKILDSEGYSYFVCLTSTEFPFIKCCSAILDKKNYCYSEKIIESRSNKYDKLISIKETLAFSPFSKDEDNKRKNYYKLNKYKKKPYIEIQNKSGILEFN